MFVASHLGPLEARSELPRVALVAPSSVRGGAEEYLRTLALAARRAGWNVHVALPAGGGELEGLFDDQQLRVHHVSLGGAHRDGKLGAATRLGRDLSRTLAFLLRVRPDVALLNLPNPEQSPGAMLATSLLGIPTAVVFHLVPAGFRTTPPRRRLYAAARRRQCWVTVSEHSRRVLAGALGLDPAELLLIHNGVPPRPPSSRDQRREARAAVIAELSLAEDATIILTAARLNGQKAHDRVLDAAPEIWRRVPGAVLLWAGRGERGQELRDRVWRMGEQQRVRFLGQRTDVSRLLAAADLFLFPSRFEGLSFAVLEAMAAGTPVLASREAVTPELFEHGRDGLLYQLDDDAELVERLAWGVEHPAELSVLADAAAVRVAQHFSQEQMLSQTMGLLLRLSVGAASGRG